MRFRTSRLDRVTADGFTQTLELVRLIDKRLSLLEESQKEMMDLIEELVRSYVKYVEMKENG